MKEKTWIEIFKKQRRDWGEINPATKVIPNKKKYTRKQKHKEKDYDEQ